VPGREVVAYKRETEDIDVEDEYETPQYTTTPPPPSILLVNRESRATGLKYYTLRFESHAQLEGVANIIFAAPRASGITSARIAFVLGDVTQKMETWSYGIGINCHPCVHLMRTRSQAWSLVP
jgi:hypothetical protein